MVNSYFENSIETVISEVEKFVYDFSAAKNYSCRWVVLKMLEEYSKIIQKLQPSDAVINEISNLKEGIEKKFDDDMETIVSDKIVTNRILAIPLLLLVMSLMFRITFGVIVNFTVDWTDKFINETVSGAVSNWLQNAGAAA